MDLSMRSHCQDDTLSLRTLVTHDTVLCRFVTL